MFGAIISSASLVESFNLDLIGACFQNAVKIGVGVGIGTLVGRCTAASLGENSAVNSKLGASIGKTISIIGTTSMNNLGWMITYPLNGVLGAGGVFVANELSTYFNIGSSIKRDEERSSTNIEKVATKYFNGISLLTLSVLGTRAAFGTKALYVLFGALAVKTATTSNFKSMMKRVVG